MRRRRVTSGTPARRRAAREADEAPDEVVCRLCGESYRAIGYLHLRRVHEFEGDHPVEDYKGRYGLRVAACRDVCHALRDRRIERAKRAGRHFTKDRVLEELQRRARAHEPLAVRSLSMAFYLTIRRRFGTWTRAVRSAGLDPADHRLIRRWVGPRLVEAVRRLHAASEDLCASTVLREHPDVYRGAVRRHGNWSAALRAAGLDPSAHRKPSKWSGAAAREWIRARRARGRPITAAHVPRGLHARVCREVRGGWSALVESLGTRYPGIRRRRDWTDAAVLAEIRARRRRGLPLHREAACSEGQALVQQARTRFGSWDGALRAAGIDPAGVRLTRRWARADVLRAIRSRRSAGKSMRFAVARAEEPRLVKAAQRRFPSSWARALAAAGLDPALARSTRAL